MIAVLSPAKTMREENFNIKTTQPLFPKQTNQLLAELKKMDVADLMDLMNISEKLAILNHDRFNGFKKARRYPAGWLFGGDVYNGLAIDDFTEDDIAYADKHIRILSGLYGILRLRDEISPYRLEMGTRLKTKKGNNLYQFWDDQVAKQLLKSPAADFVVNLASVEYNKVLQLKSIDIPVLDIEFKEIRQGKPIGIPLYSKIARGSMARYMVKSKANKKEDLKNFDYDDYSYSEHLSNEWKYVFVR